MQDSVATCIFLVTNAIEEKYHQEINVSHILGNSIFFCFQDKTRIINKEIVKYVQETLNNIVYNPNVDNNKIIIELETKSTILKELLQRGRKTTELQIKSLDSDYLLCARYNNYFDVCLDPMITQISEIGKFCVKSFELGFIVTIIPPFQRLTQYPIHLHNATLNIKSSLGSKDILTLNNAKQFLLKNRTTDQHILDKMFQNESAESLSQKILNDYPLKRIICISGPKSGGKTLFASKLAFYLTLLGYPTHILSTDLYQKDYQILSILIKKFFSGETITILKEENDEIIEENIKPTKKSLIIIDGIDSIDQKLLNYIEPLQSIKIYTGPHSPIHIDNNHCISTSDICLIRILQKEFSQNHHLDIIDDEEIEPFYLLSYLPNFDYYINTFSLHDFNHPGLELKLEEKNNKKVEGDVNWYEILKIRKISAILQNQNTKCNSFYNEKSSHILEQKENTPSIATL